MATEKETLQAQADELGLDTTGTIAQLKESIAAAEAEEGAPPADPSPEVVDAPVAPEPTVDADLPAAPINPAVVKAPAPVASSAMLTYEVMSAFWLRTSAGMALAQMGGTVKLTQAQAKKYLRYGNIKLAA